MPGVRDRNRSSGTFGGPGAASTGGVGGSSSFVGEGGTAPGATGVPGGAGVVGVGEGVGGVVGVGAGVGCCWAGCAADTPANTSIKTVARLAAVDRAWRMRK